jgi:magnesium transporter
MPDYLRIVAGRLEECAEGEAQVCVHTSPGADERKGLVEHLKLDEHTLASSLDPDELARVELEPDHLAIIFKRPKGYSAPDQLVFRVNSVGFFLFRDRLVAILPEGGRLFDGRPLANIQSVQELTLKILMRTVQHFTGHLKVIHTMTDEIEQRIEKSVENSSLLQLFAFEKSLVYYVNAIHSNTGVIERLKNNAQNPTTAGFTPQDVEFIDDLLIENRQGYELAMISSNILAGLMDARASIISNNLNVMMMNLNALVIAVSVPSFFAAVGGMSEFSAVFGLQKHLVIGYVLFLLIMLLLGVSIFYLIRRFERLWH